MQRQSEFRISIEPHLLMDRRCLRPELGDSEARIALMRLGYASRHVMADSDRRGWFCLAVEPGREVAVEKRLSKFHINTYVAVRPDRMARRRGREKLVAGGPLIVGYVLVECGLHERAFLGMSAILDVSGVLGGAASPWRISDRNIEIYRDHVASGAGDDDEADDIDRPLAAGDEVFVTAGPWIDFHGDIVQVKKASAVVRVAVMGRGCDVEMPLAYFRKL